MKHVAVLTFPIIVAGLMAGSCSSKGTHTSHSSAPASSTRSAGPAAAPKVIATITVGKKPENVAVDSAAKTGYVTNSGDDTVSVIDATSNAVKTTVKVGKKPDGAAVDSQAKKAVVTNEGDDSVSIIDTGSNELVGG